VPERVLHAVKVGASEGLVIETSAVNERVVGFMHTGKATAANDHVTLYVTGVVWARAAAAITFGDPLESAADGEVQTAGVSNLTCGIALGTADAANELIPVLITLGTELAAS
jgi:hypothetical protein